MRNSDHLGHGALRQAQGVTCDDAEGGASIFRRLSRLTQGPQHFLHEALLSVAALDDCRPGCRPYETIEV
jgi:hypothetical protein